MGRELEIANKWENVLAGRGEIKVALDAVGDGDVVGDGGKARRESNGDVIIAGSRA